MGETFLKKVKKTILDHQMFSVGDSVVVAVSGGADSVALLDVLVSLKEFQLNLIVAHLNHQLRGAESDGDEEFVRTLAATYGLPCRCATVDVKVLSCKEKCSLEDAGRRARYAFLARVAADEEANLTALAHHADDQAETVLMRLIRGAAGTGLSAIAANSSNGLVRPLLKVNRAEIEEYLYRRGLAWRNDSSNTDKTFLRNRIRHELIPLLESYNPAIRERLATTAEVLSADENVLEAIIDEVFNRHCTVLEGRVSLAVPALRQELPGIRLRLYRRALQGVKGDLARISSTHIRDIDQIVLSATPHLTLSLPEGLRVTKSYDALEIAKTSNYATDEVNEITIEGPGCFSLQQGGKLVVDVINASGEFPRVEPGKACFDLMVVPFPWQVRYFRSGDRFNPLGMSGHKKVKDFFIDKKIPRNVRQHIPIVTNCGEIIWVGGLRAAGKGCVTSATQEIAIVQLLEFNL